MHYAWYTTLNLVRLKDGLKSWIQNFTNSTTIMLNANVNNINNVELKMGLLQIHETLLQLQIRWHVLKCFPTNKYLYLSKFSALAYQRMTVSFHEDINFTCLIMWGLEWRWLLIKMCGIISRLILYASINSSFTTRTICYH